MNPDEIERDLAGRYQIVRPLGAGAFGAVFLAREVQLHRLVAIKVLKTERLGSDEERERFRREARTVGQLSHPAIVPLLAFGESERAIYMVMPYVAGESLAAALRRDGRIDPAEARRLLVEVADAVAYAHGQGVLHRDIKPENVLLEASSPGDDSPPRVRLIDFGVAAFPTRDAGVRASQESWGTPHFMAPEQAFGEPELDPRSELYSIGVLGYLMLGGRLPFEATNPTERLVQQQKGPAIPLHVCAPDAPKDLVSAIERCLAFEPERRWRDARDFRDTLLQSFVGASPSARALAKIRQRVSPRRRAVHRDRVDIRGAFRALFATSGVSADIHFGLRMLRKAPGFSTAIIVTLALGLAATTSVFSLLDALVLRPPPVADPKSLVMLEESHDTGHPMNFGSTSFAYDRYVAYAKAMTTVFTGLAGQDVQDFSLREGTTTRPLGGLVTTGNYFEVLGVHPALGRFYDARVDQPGRQQPVAVVGYDFWATALHGDSAAIGHTIYLDSRPLTIVGVAPRGFHGAMAGMYAFNVWVPATAYRPTTINDMSVNVFGRLRPGVTADQAYAALKVAFPRIPMRDPSSHVLDAWVEPLHLLTRDSRDFTARYMNVLFAIAGMVLLIAAANSAGMLLARGLARRREVATRLAVGATRARLMRQLFLESVLLSVAGGGLGLLLTLFITRAFAKIPSPAPWPIEAGVAVNAKVFVVAAIGVLGAGLVAGLAPAFQVTSVDLASAMKASGFDAGSHRTRLRSVFVVAQIAASVLLLAMAGLFTRSLARALDTNPGFDAKGVVVGAVRLGPHGYDSATADALLTQLLQRLRARPEVAMASLAAAPPLSGDQRTGDVRAAERPGDKPLDTQYTPAGVGLLELLRVPILAGRTFTNADGPRAQRVALINERLAQQLWPDRNPRDAVGRSITIYDVRYTIIGLVATGKYLTLQDGARPFAYVSLAQDGTSYPTIFVRARSDQGAALRALREELAVLNPNIALERPAYLAEWVDRYISGQRLGATLIAIFGLVGVLLAATGIYGVLSYSVAQRSREFGVRMALGARRGDVVRLVLNNTASLLATGVVIGLLGAFACGRVISSFLFGLSPTDPVTLSAVPLILGVVGVLASVVPVRRATEADPMVALRAE